MITSGVEPQLQSAGESSNTPAPRAGALRVARAPPTGSTHRPSRSPNATVAVSSPVRKLRQVPASRVHVPRRDQAVRREDGGAEVGRAEQRAAHLLQHHAQLDRSVTMPVPALGTSMPTSSTLADSSFHSGGSKPRVSVIFPLVRAESVHRGAAADCGWARRLGGSSGAVGPVRCSSAAPDPLTTTLPGGVRTFLGDDPETVDAAARPARPPYQAEHRGPTGVAGAGVPRRNGCSTEILDHLNDDHVRDNPAFRPLRSTVPCALRWRDLERLCGHGRGRRVPAASRVERGDDRMPATLERRSHRPDRRHRRSVPAADHPEQHDDHGLTTAFSTTAGAHDRSKIRI